MVSEPHNTLVSLTVFLSKNMDDLTESRVAQFCDLSSLIVIGMLTLYSCKKRALIPSRLYISLFKGVQRRRPRINLMKQKQFDKCHH